jgi:hypothetical protein
MEVGMRRSSILFVFAAMMLALSSAGSALAQEKADNAKILGTWNIDVYAGDQTYSLVLNVSEVNGQLAGKISETMGTFTDAAISEISFDGAAFRFSFVAPTPPDGSSRTIKADLKLSGDAMGGTITVPDLDVVADARATRAK